MKKTKILLTLVCAVLLIAASVMGTLAYLTDTEEVKNTFTVGKVELKNGEKGAGLDEAKTNLDGQPVNGDGTVVELENAPRVTGNEYKLVPGHTYTKDPTVHVAAGSEDCWIFVTVKNDIAAYEVRGNDITSQIALNGWKLGGTTSDGTLYYRTHESNAKQVDYKVFGQFTIADTADKIDGWSSINYDKEAKSGTTVEVKAYAIQMDGFEDNKEGAWAAFGDVSKNTTWVKLESPTPAN